MTTLIVIRLHPVEPIEGSEFTDYLNDLVITAYDASFDHPEGEKIGEAKYLPTILPNPLNRISQHIKITIPPLPAPPIIDLLAVATAVIEVPDGLAEYMTRDIRLVITRGGKEIINRIVHYNVPEIPLVPLPLPNQMEETFPIPYSNLQNAGIYLALPVPAIGLDPSVAYVDLPADGQAPKFDDLMEAINLVLAKDPDTANADLEHLSPLTPAQSRHVAAEIAWNRTLYPPPDLPRSLEKMYTKPDGDSDEAEMDRKQFDAEHTAYHATHDAEAGRLAGFVFAASAAVACEQLSAKAASAGLKFPLITGASTATTIPNTTVVLIHQFPLNPPFTVPAAYFYAIGAMMPVQVNAQQRYDMARRETESRLLSEFQTAIDAGAIVVPAKPVTTPAAPSINPDQAARRLDALGSTEGSFPKVTLTAPVTIIVQNWLKYTEVSEKIDTLFWIDEVEDQSAAYLRLILHVVTKNYQLLIDAIMSTVTNVSELVKIWDQQWRDFFLNIDPTILLVPPPDFA
ncbi:MAG: insecticidal toxin complex protein, partial [Candidatus Aminicenantes bacterium]